LSDQPSKSCSPKKAKETQQLESSRSATVEESLNDAVRVPRAGPGAAARFEQLFTTYYNELPGTDVQTIRQAIQEAMGAMGI
jgi:hypothetical protein